jgi:hypothetical protein
MLETKSVLVLRDQISLTIEELKERFKISDVACRLRGIVAEMLHGLLSSDLVY